MKVTVRTLHHWDAIGLVRPSGRTTRGYRLYSAADVARIHRVLIYRELGLSLDDIGELLDAPTVDMTVPLRQQRVQLLDRISRLQAMVDAVDRMIEAASAGILLSAEEQVAIFGQRCTLLRELEDRLQPASPLVDGRHLREDHGRITGRMRCGGGAGLDGECGSTVVRAHQHAAGARHRQPADFPVKGIPEITNR